VIDLSDFTFRGEMNNHQLVQLGKTGIMVSPVGLGTMQWGSMKVQFEPTSPNRSASEIFQKSLELGVNFFDTAEMYGFGRSETLLGKCYRDVSTDIIIATKFMPFPWRLSKRR
jgi:aryl-alcohol dehydrogenase-like predicted oxidoreductase